MAGIKELNAMYAEQLVADIEKQALSYAWRILIEKDYQEHIKSRHPDTYMNTRLWRVSKANVRRLYEGFHATCVVMHCVTGLGTRDLEDAAMRVVRYLYT